MDSIKKAVVEAGGLAQLAAILGVGTTAISNWQMRKQVPANRCIAIEEATGGKVTRYDLRPDVFGPAPAKQEKVA